MIPQRSWPSTPGWFPNCCILLLKALPGVLTFARRASYSCLIYLRYKFSALTLVSSKRKQSLCIPHGIVSFQRGSWRSKAAGWQRGASSDPDDGKRKEAGTCFGTSAARAASGQAHREQAGAPRLSSFWGWVRHWKNISKSRNGTLYFMEHFFRSTAKLLSRVKGSC